MSRSTIWRRSKRGKELREKTQLRPRKRNRRKKTEGEQLLNKKRKDLEKNKRRKRPKLKD